MTLLNALFLNYSSVMYWKISLQITNQAKLSGLSSLVLKTNSIPSGGYCQIDKTKGIALSTLFSISCYNWDDLDGTIVRYEYYGII